MQNAHQFFGYGYPELWAMGVEEEEEEENLGEIERVAPIKTELDPKHEQLLHQVFGRDNDGDCTSEHPNIRGRKCVLSSNHVGNHVSFTETGIGTCSWTKRPGENRKHSDYGL